ncbi:MAG: response regulator [Gammaproteobacteria bacterium]|uniref:response regulator n=1 Tax=Limnobacter sp. TaxID=2003368 RepID=UPI001D80C2A0|nr:response regulator [Limnobacter sp.]MBU0784901.1 response regulator [Gammaproteobacteria bacterium]MBU0848317.1 response regulator [Gammaproteobacteria bacterium]MBU1267010.1 response regulator [Gammaproteobacteria bacterium]MBU1529549.1 response regulator [Gammaproteobacteria bacterium]MBU1781130.1 response regulator [Gammaproteobacteria bacterium]
MPRVMIVEDDLTILSNLSQLLQLSGLDVTEVCDGEMALAYLQESHSKGFGMPCLIVSDLMMPKMDGFELLRTVRNDAAFKSIPFVLLSARSEASDLQQAFALGANDYLIKPFEVEHLTDVIRYHISKSTGQAGGTPVAGFTADTDFFLE